MIILLPILIFIWMEFYYVINKVKLDQNIKNKSIETTTIVDLIYYFSRFLYFIWLVWGLFSNQYELFYTLLFLRFLNFIFYYINRKLSIIWDNILPSFSIILMLVIAFYQIKG